MNKLEKLAAKAARAIIDIEIYGWPPVCFGMFYQPQRPTQKPKDTIELFKEKPSKEKLNLQDHLRTCK